MRQIYKCTCRWCCHCFNIGINLYLIELHRIESQRADYIIQNGLKNRQCRKNKTKNRTKDSIAIIFRMKFSFIFLRWLSHGLTHAFIGRISQTIHVPFLNHFSSFVACKFQCRICLRVQYGVWWYRFFTMKYSHFSNSNDITWICRSILR